MRLFHLLGFSPRNFFYFIKSFPGYLSDYRAYKKQLSTNKNLWPFGKTYPIFHDKYEESGILSGAYFHQDLLVAKKIYQKKPTKHVDVGSRTDGFVAHVSVFMPIEIIDIRPQNSKVENISFLQADLMNPIGDTLFNYCDSISSLHAIEHFGLGRYGDPIDANGYIKALNNIYLMLKPGGAFYFSVPLGPQRIEFNAQRIFSLAYLLSLFQNKYEIVDFSFVDDKGDLHQNVLISDNLIQDNCNCSYGCAIFELQKL
ncbi:MAG TPA: DUF268 domain-containing protein [Chitinophagaceae bacterium]|jgi:SAM-dependent methyltransferase|nr:DUF268 domain-containing protein [Chitinophagaceae bacterium]